MAEEKIVYDNFSDNVRFTSVAVLSLIGVIFAATGLWIPGIIFFIACFISGQVKHRLTFFLEEGMVELDRTFADSPGRQVLEQKDLRGIEIDFTDTGTKSGNIRTYSAQVVFSKSRFTPFTIAQGQKLDEVVKTAQDLVAKTQLGVIESPKLKDLRIGLDTIGELAERPLRTRLIQTAKRDESQRVESSEEKQG
ncbi:MAG: hypothetical protein H7Y17_01645 [Chlorobia bacterium]|nr:hypothetical protein [Fimbriimonadaceae bacterium]